MTDHDHDHRPNGAIPIIPPPFGVPPSWVKLTGQIVDAEGVTEIEEELWIVGFIDPLLNEPAAGGPVVLTPFGAITLGVYVRRRQLTDVKWSVVIQTPAMMQHDREMQRNAALAAINAQQPRIHVAGPLGPRS